MTTRFRRNIVSVSITVPAAKFAGLRNRFGSDAVKPFIDEMMREHGKALKRHLMTAADDAFKGSTYHTFRDSAFYRYDTAGQALTVGFHPQGRSNPETGRPLAQYFIPIQSDLDTPTMTDPPNPPLVWITSSGRLGMSRVVRDRLAKWAASVGATNPIGMAIVVAKKFQTEGMVRRPVFTKVFRSKTTRGTAPKSLVSATQPGSDPRSEVLSIQARTRERIIRFFSRSVKP